MGPLCLLCDWETPTAAGGWPPWAPKPKTVLERLAIDVDAYFSRPRLRLVASNDLPDRHKWPAARRALVLTRQEHLDGELEQGPKRRRVRLVK